MLEMERLHFVFWGCVGEGTQDSDCTAVLNFNGGSLKEEGTLVVIICALCDAPSNVLSSKCLWNFCIYGTI